MYSSTKPYVSVDFISDTVLIFTRLPTASFPFCPRFATGCRHVPLHHLQTLREKIVYVREAAALRIIDGRPSPPILRIDMNTARDEVFDEVHMPRTRSDVQRRAQVVVSRVRVAVTLQHEIEAVEFAFLGAFT